MAAPQDLLRRVPLFAQLDDKHLSRLADEFSQRSFSAGDTIAAEGEGGRTFFVIEDGEAAVSVGGREVGTLGPGDSFGEIALIDRGGTVIADAPLASFAHLPMVVGDGANLRAAELIAMLAQDPGWRQAVTAAVWVGNRRWNVRLDNGVDIRLPEVNGAAAWAELATLQREHGLVDRDLTAIDMRQPDRLIVRLTPEAAARRRDPGDAT